MQCGSVGCKQEFDYELMKKVIIIGKEEKTFYYAGVNCPVCAFTHCISPLYLKKFKAEEQVIAHNYRVGGNHAV